jgi:hypothetical protein
MIEEEATKEERIRQVEVCRQRDLFREESEKL